MKWVRIALVTTGLLFSPLSFSSQKCDAYISIHENPFCLNYSVSPNFPFLASVNATLFLGTPYVDVLSCSIDFSRLEEDNPYTLECGKYTVTITTFGEAGSTITQSPNYLWEQYTWEVDFYKYAKYLNLDVKQIAVVVLFANLQFTISNPQEVICQNITLSEMYIGPFDPSLDVPIFVKEWKIPKIHKVTQYECENH